MDCSDNNMTSLPPQVLPNTEQLVMIGNNLGNLTFINKAFTFMKTIDLRRSNVQKITSEALDAFSTKTNVHQLPNKQEASVIQTKLWLSNNPFICNCDMMWMKDWLQNATNVLDRENVTCGPGEWNGNCKQFMMLSIQTWPSLRMCMICWITFALVVLGYDLQDHYRFRCCHLPVGQN